MPPEITRTIVETIRQPSPEERAEALVHLGDSAAHARFLATWPCLNSVELVRAAPDTVPAGLTVSAWNLDRCRDVGAAAAFIARSGVDIVLASELDAGMARSGQAHTAREIAAQLGFDCAFGVEFVELSLGNSREIPGVEAKENAAGLHGNAILSRLPLGDVTRLALDAGGQWFQPDAREAQYRVGGRMAIAARVETASGPLILAAGHLESDTDAAGRGEQMQSLLRLLTETYGPGPAVVGGDLNTREFQEADLSPEQTLARAAEVDPVFAAAAASGFSWRAANTGRVTTRKHPDAPPDMPRRAIDWLLTRGVEASAPAVVAALDPSGAMLSDHEMVTARIAP